MARARVVEHRDRLAGTTDVAERAAQPEQRARLGVWVEPEAQRLLVLGNRLRLATGAIVGVGALEHRPGRVSLRHGS